jgi:hypothetical protein
MADFNVRIAERQFSRLGVSVEFDENLYGELLDELAPTVPEQKTPVITVVPAPIWGASWAYKLASEVGGREKDWPGGDYDWRTATIDILASEKVDETNKSLLYETRVWSADVSGEYAEAYQIMRNRRGYRRATLLGIVRVGAIAGFELMGSSDGVLVGGIVGLLPGVVPSIVDNQKNPRFKEWRQFSKDPNVIAKFGRVISYRQA